MEIYQLPEHFNPEKNQNFLVFNYQSNKENNKNKVLLQMNTFSFLREGYKEVFANNKPISIDNNHFLLMKKGHCLMTERLSDTNNSYNSILFFVSDEAIENFINQYKLSTPKKTNTKPIHSFKYDNYLNNFVNSLIEINKLETSVKQSLLTTKFHELMHYLMATQDDNFLFSLSNKQSSTQQHLTTIVEANKYEKLSLSELAFLANMSLSTFKREFQKQYNTPPSKWFLEQRLAYATILLKTKRPSEIYQEIGYESLSNFIQAFKNKYGATPKQHQTK